MFNEKAYADIYGNGIIKNALKGFTEKGSFPDSLIISGPDGSGKKTFAKLAAMTVACRSESRPCMSCESCRKIKEDICPDVIRFAKGKDRASIGVEAVRRIKDSAYILPNELDTKVFIIDDADTMTVQAQNALLKLFEEPPATLKFILLCRSVSNLLPTVRSRGPELKTELFTERQLAEILTENSKKADTLYKTEPKKFSRLLHMASGSYGKALELIQNGDKKSIGELESAEQAVSLLGGASRSEFIMYMQKQAVSREALGSILRFMILAVRDMAAVRKCREVRDLMLFSDISEARSRAAGYSLKSLINIESCLIEAEAEITDINLNLYTSATVIAQRLWSLK